jgi:glutamine amidotransferase
MSKIIIIDYNLGNLFSVQHACTSLGLDAKISQDPKEIKQAKAIILPGVGAFNEAMNNLKKLNLRTPIQDHVNEGKPFFGICLGLQLLFTESDEFGNSKGLNLIPGKVLKFPKEVNGNKLIVPQIGWNTITPTNNGNGFKNTPLEDLKDNEFAYFVHSYYVLPDNQADSLTNTDYEGHHYCSSIIKNNIFATQFHPEKSGIEGLKIYRNWAKQNNLI